MAAANLVSSGAGSPLVESTFGSERGLKIDGGEGGGGVIAGMVPRCAPPAFKSRSAGHRQVVRARLRRETHFLFFLSSLQRLYIARVSLVSPLRKRRIIKMLFGKCIGSKNHDIEKS